VLSLVGLYAFATSITATDAINLARSSTAKNATGEPTGAFVAQLDAERLLAIVYLSAPTGANLARLQLQEAKTSQVSGALRAALTSSATMNNASAVEKRAIAVLLSDVSNLPSLRSQIAAQIIGRARAFATYNAMGADADLVLNAVIRQQTNAPLVTQALAFVRMGRSEDMLLQENTLLLADLAARSFPAADLQQFTELVGARRELLSQTLPDLDPAYRTYYVHDVSPQANAALMSMENAVMRGTYPGSIPQVQPLAWENAVQTVSAGLSAAGSQSADALTVQAHTAARTTYLRLIVAGGAGLIAVILSIVMSLLIGRRQVRELAALRESALELANVRLPDVVARLAAGQHVDVPADEPAPAHTSDEIGQVRQAFATVQQTAVEAAVGQAKLRQGISDIFRNLARRSQSLLHRQLAVLDAMERRTRDPHELEDLFRVDHLATRMRRHAESLIILSGESPARGWRQPVPLVDVLRAAVAEVEDYTRIKVTASTQSALAGPAVGDVIHMIAELAENATIYSPPHTPVLITGSIVGQGFAVEIEDRGLGLSTEHRAQINERLENPPDFDLSGTDQLGLFVAGRLAKRHHIKISLRNSPYGGTTAIVLIPHNLVVPEGDRTRDRSTGQAQGLPLTTARRAVRYEHKLSGSTGTTGSSGAPVPGRGHWRAPTPATASLAAWPEAANDLPGWPQAETILSDWPELEVSPDSADSADSAQSPDGPAEGAGQQEPGARPSGAGTVFAGTVFAAAAQTPAISGAATGTANESTPGAGIPAGTAAGAWSATGAGRAAVSEPAGAGAGLDEDDLPRRVRQASLAPQLRDSPVRPPSLPDVAIQTTRSPEETRVTMSAIQRGWERGRSVFDASGTDEPASEPVGAAVTPEADTASAASHPADTATAASPRADTATAVTPEADTATAASPRADTATAVTPEADTATSDTAGPAGADAGTGTGRANGDSAAPGTHRSDD
jgi:signal transduction histidine kinase